MFGKEQFDDSDDGRAEEERDLMNKISKLLAKAESTDHEPEAEAFRCKAQDLMEKHSLSRGDLEMKDFREVQVQSRYKAEPRWYASLLFDITRYLGVYAIRRRTGTGRQQEWTMYGHRRDIQLARYMVGSIIPQIEDLTTEYKEELRERGYDSIRRKANGYREGVAERVSSRLWSMAEDVSGGEAEKALVPVEERKEKREKGKSMYDGNATSYSSSGASDTASKMEGYQDGDKVNIHKATKSPESETQALTA